MRWSAIVIFWLPLVILRQDFHNPPLLKGPSLIQYEGYSFVLDLFTVFFSKNSSKYLETIVPKLAKENNAHKKEEFQVETDENNI